MTAKRMIRRKVINRVVTVVVGVNKIVGVVLITKRILPIKSMDLIFSDSLIY